ncbi:MAG: FHA domain-containing protein [Lachnospiraceae bacterium]
MAVIRCSRGHYFDDGKYTQCPHCGILLHDDDITVPLPLSQINQRWEDTDDGKTIAINAGMSEETFDEDDKTISLYVQQNDGDPVTGWLVCVAGAEIGRDFRLHQGFNRIGRSYEMDVPIMEDPMVRTVAECAIVYDNRGNRFYAVQQEGIAYLNGNLLQSPCTLTSGDILRVGESEFEFVAFCREERVWEKE